MFLQVIWNPKIKQTSLCVHHLDTNEEFKVIIAFSLKETVSTDFAQNFIAFEDFNFSYLEDQYFWLENFSLTKNILAFFNILELIELTSEDLLHINSFILKEKISINDSNSLGFQSPVKTIPRDLHKSPLFMSRFLAVGDNSKRLLRTTFDFIEDSLFITINKRDLTLEHFFNHLNSDRDRIRIQESLAYPITGKEDLLHYFSQLDYFSNIVSNNDSISVEDVIDLVDSGNESIHPEQLKSSLAKEKIQSISLFSFIQSSELLPDKRESVLEDFKETIIKDFPTADESDDFIPPINNSYTEESDNSVYIESSIEKPIMVEETIEEELTEDFLVEIETNLKNHEESQKQNDNINELEIQDVQETETHPVSVDDLVDSINDIFEDNSLELFDIIELPLISFLNEVKLVDNIIQSTSDNSLDSYFSENNVNEEINDFSAEEVLTAVKTEVSIFENTVHDKKKKGKYKKDKYLVNTNVNLIQDSSINNETVHSHSEFIEPVLTLNKIESDSIFIYQFVQSYSLIIPLIKNSVIKISIIDFIISSELSDNETTLVPDNVSEFVVENPNFNFFEENKKRLIDLAMEGNIEEIEILYRDYPDFEKPLINFNYEGDNPLCIAAFHENIDLLKKLIEYGWNANYFDANLNNALIIACAEGHKNIVKYLLTQDLQINFQNKKGYTALHFAVNDCNHRIVKLLLEAGADVELSDNDRNTPLSIAAFKGDLNSTKLLLQTRVNVHTKNKKGYDARSIALIAKHHAIAKLIEDKIVSDKHNHSLPPIIEKNV